LGGGFGVGSKLSLRFAMSRRQRFLEDRKQNFINYIRKGGNMVRNKPKLAEVGAQS
jgi:hypothetical protein